MSSVDERPEPAAARAWRLADELRAVVDAPPGDADARRAATAPVAAASRALGELRPALREGAAAGGVDGEDAERLAALLRRVSRWQAADARSRAARCRRSACTPRSPRAHDDRARAPTSRLTSPHQIRRSRDFLHHAGPRRPRHVAHAAFATRAAAAVGGCPAAAARASRGDVVHAPPPTCIGRRRGGGGRSSSRSRPTRWSDAPPCSTRFAARATSPPPRRVARCPMDRVALRDAPWGGAGAADELPSRHEGGGAATVVMPPPPPRPRW